MKKALNVKEVKRAKVIFKFKNLFLSQKFYVTSFGFFDKRRRMQLFQVLTYLRIA